MTPADALCCGILILIFNMMLFFYVIHRYIIYVIQDFSEYIHPARKEHTRNAWDDRNLKPTQAVKNLKKALFGEWDK